MSKHISFGSIQIGASAAGDTSSPRREGEFRVALIGDFTGRRNRGITQPDGMLRETPVFVDRDNFDQVLEQLDIRLELQFGESDTAPQTVRFRDLDDFLPDRIYDRAEVFAALRALRRRLLNPATFAQAASELIGALDTQKEEATSTKGSEPSQHDAKSEESPPESLLDMALAATENDTTNRPSSTGSPLVDHLIQEIIAPHVIAAPDPRQAELVAGVDAAVAEQMRAILHHPDFQALEAAWRGLYFLVRRLETDTHLKLLLIDVSKEELAADLKQHEDLARTATYKMLVEQSTETAGGRPWSLLMGDFFFDSSPDDVALLGRMAKIAARAGAPFLAGSLPSIVGCDSFGETSDPDDWQLDADPERQDGWAALRSLPVAAYLGLAMPRVLLRLPYGTQTNAIESFDFEEMRDSPQHDDYLWGNAAWMCTWALAQAYIEDGWQLDAGRVRDIDGLPLHVFKEDGESVVKPCAEAWLVDRAAQEIARHGITPLVSVRNADTVRIPGVRSLADPPSPLACGD